MQEALLIGINILVLIAVSAQAYFVNQQVMAMHSSLALDHDRRTKQGTIDHWVSTSSGRNALRSVFVSRYGKDTLSTEQVREIQGDEYGEVAQSLIRYLNDLEYFSAGLNSGVFDYGMADALCGGTLISAANRYRPWIEHRRATLNRPSLWRELEICAGEIARRRQQPTSAPQVGRVR